MLLRTIFHVCVFVCVCVISMISFQSKHTKEMMVRALLDEFKDCNAETFENLQDILKGSSQAHLATSLRNSLVEIQNEEAKVGSDFIGELIL